MSEQDSTEGQGQEDAESADASGKPIPTVTLGPNEPTAKKKEKQKQQTADKAGAKSARQPTGPRFSTVRYLGKKHPGQFWIRSTRAGGKCLDVEGARAESASLTVWPCDPNDDHLWAVKPAN